MVIVNYSERQYEQMYNTELICTYGADGRLYVPSPVEERELGFDAAHIILPSLIDNSVGSNTCVGMNNRNTTSSSDVNDLHNPLRNVPDDYIANYFCQFKRPHYLSTRRAREYTTFNGPYFRYELDQDQLNTLIGLNNDFINSGTPAHILYVSSTARNITELYNQSTQSDIFKKSSHAEVSNLSGHHYVAYQTPQSYHAFSEPIKHESFNFDNIKTSENFTSLKSTQYTMEKFLSENNKKAYDRYIMNKKEKDFISEKISRIHNIQWMSDYLNLSWGMIIKNQLS